MKKIVFFIILFVASGTAKPQTTTPLAQYSGNQMIFNPGFAGVHDLFSANLSLRRLWMGIPGAPTLISLNMHAPFIDHRNALGFIYQRETFGPQFINLINLAYAYKIHVGAESFLNLGMQAGLFNSVTDWGMVEYVRHPEDPAYGYDNRLQTNSLDLSFGLHFQTRNFYLGLSARHLTAPKFDEITDVEIERTIYSRVPRQFFLMGGYNITLTDALDLRPRILMRYKKGTPFTVSTGIDIIYNNRFSFGANYMTGLPVITLSAGIEVVQGLKVGYAFDMNYGVLRPFQRGSHEISINYFMRVWTRANEKQAKQYFI